MQAMSWKQRAVRYLAIPAIFSLGVATALGIHQKAGSAPSEPPVQPPAQALSTEAAFEQVADKLRPSVVFIQSQQTINAPRVRRSADDGQDFPGFPGAPGGRRPFGRSNPYMEASGSGVIVRSDGYILTNDHVVDGADKVTVTLQDGREFPGEVKRDFKSDLALVKIHANNLPAAELADSDRVKVGQWAIAFGSPFGLSDTMTVGVVSSLHREQVIGGNGPDGRLYPSLLQTDASINPGNSGGPLVDLYGRVVGINVAIESPSGGNVGIGFAIPANTARYIMNDLITTGKVVRGYLGMAPVTPSYAQKQKYGVQSGALVARVETGSPAASGGLQVEDMIVRYNGKSVTDDAMLREMVARTAPGETAILVVKRNGEEKTLHVAIGSTPDELTAQNSAPEQQTERGKRGSEAP
ncbi:MAG TPA: trypsin-like peptidase domain-containing protein [Chthonomonadaceae bacterium]|nr:trypsin-like peptidase domain-containing protein [Chthonomonadaceae bacterium]